MPATNPAALAGYAQWEQCGPQSDRIWRQLGIAVGGTPVRFRVDNL